MTETDISSADRAKPRREGFWRRYEHGAPPPDEWERETLATGWPSDEPAPHRLPWPAPEPGWPDRAAFLAALEHITERADAIGYRGYSHCRLCGQRNGAVEYHLSGWVWPEGFAHYIACHEVRPSADFERFVLGSQTTDIEDNLHGQSDETGRLDGGRF